MWSIADKAATWGNTKRGGDSSNCSVVAATLADGHVVTWGDPKCGGVDGSRVQDNKLRQAALRRRSAEQFQQICGPAQPVLIRLPF